MPEQQGQPSEADKVHSLADGHARACLQEAQRSGDLPRPGVAVQADGGWTVLVAVFPTPVKAAATTPDLSDCERDCITLLSASQKPLTAEKVCYELEAQGIAVYSEISVKRALANLRKRLRLVANTRKRPRGYYLPDTSAPLLGFRDGA